ncbi:MAG: RNA methyltransferase [Acidimicrobiia bacterium]
MVDAARLHRAKTRRERGQTLIEGPHLVQAAIEAGAVISAVFALERSESTPPDTLLVDDRALARLAGTETPRGPIAVLDIPQEQNADGLNLLVAYGLSDPGNMGALIRIAAGFGWAFAHTPGSADPWSPKVMRAAAGGHFQTPIVTFSQQSQVTTVATVVDGGTDLESVRGDRLAVLVGEEASGLPPEVVASADFAITIDLPGPVESLNAAVAAGIVVYELSNQGRNQRAGV